MPPCRFSNVENRYEALFIERVLQRCVRNYGVLAFCNQASRTFEDPIDESDAPRIRLRYVVQGNDGVTIGGVGISDLHRVSPPLPN